MNHKQVSRSAADWALSQVGCSYSQPNRDKPGTFDCSSLVARAYSAQGKRWHYGGSIPISCHEVYDDEFELLWPKDYADIGKKFGGKSVIEMADMPGDLQFIRTDTKTKRANAITHVALVASNDTIVHARGVKYGVRTDAITLYSGKICALTRYAPECALRLGMKGARTLAMQKALNKKGAGINADGEFGSQTLAAVCAFQKVHGIPVTGKAESRTLAELELTKPSNSAEVCISGKNVYVRSGPGTGFAHVAVAHKGDRFDAVDASGWIPVLLDGEVRWISARYCKK